MTQSKSTFSIAKVVTDQVIEALRSGNELPWVKPWRTAGLGVPYNPVSKTTYRGINFITLGLKNGMDAQFVTAKQAMAKGGQLKKGAAQPVVYYSPIEKEVDDGAGQKKKIRYFLMKYYNVWNISDIEGVEFPAVPQRDIVINDFAEELLKKSGVKLIEGIEARYSALTHELVMPSQMKAVSDDFYYAIMFHQLIHSTKDALKREVGQNAQGDAFEKLTAELGASMLCAHAGIDSFRTEHTAAYIQPWITALENDEKYIIFAAQRAQKAVDYLLDKTFANDSEEENLLAA